MGQVKRAKAGCYTSRGEPRVEATDGVSTIDVAWSVWEELVSVAGQEFTLWAIRHPDEWRRWRDRLGRRDGAPRRRRWWEPRR